MNSISPRQVKPEPEAQTTPWRRSIQQSSSVSMRMIHVCDINTTKFDVGRPGSGIQRTDPSQYSYLVWHDAQRNLELCTPGGDCVHTCKRKKKKKKKDSERSVSCRCLMQQWSKQSSSRVSSDERRGNERRNGQQKTNERMERENPQQQQQQQHTTPDALLYTNLHAGKMYNASINRIPWYKTSTVVPDSNIIVTKNATCRRYDRSRNAHRAVY